MKYKRALIVVLILVLGAIYYNYNNRTNPQLITITSVIDGDTLVTENYKIRLVGINTPESKMSGFIEAKRFLEVSTNNEDVYFQKTGVDQYNRLLGYIFVNDKNINEELVKNGYAHIYYYEKDQFFNQLKDAEELARNKGIGIWEPSDYNECLTLTSLNYYDKGDDNETLILENECLEELNVIIKDDATHIYEQTIKEGTTEMSFKNIFNDDGDTLYVWDEEGKLIIFYRYP